MAETETGRGRTPAADGYSTAIRRRGSAAILFPVAPGCYNEAFASKPGRRAPAVTQPVVAIVGRPNVGKSSLFNWLAGRRIAIVDPTAGVTRDRVSTLVDLDGRQVELTDTGGMGIVDTDDLTEHVERQIQLAIEQAH